VEIFESSGGNEGAKALHLINLPRTAGSPWFNKIYEAVRCDDVKRTQGLIDVSVTSTTALGNAAFSHCRDRCFQDHSCGFYAFWRKRNWCETYETCTSQSQDGNAQISVYQRLTECEAEILSRRKSMFRQCRNLLHQEWSDGKDRTKIFTANARPAPG